ncbi:MAG: hypothetical protein ACHQFZ_02645 [Acidimicrobiales bacterium]
MRPRSRFLAVSFVLAALPGVSRSLPAAASSAQPPTCAPGDVALSATPDRSHYAPGTLVHVTIVLRNHSPAACSFATGTFSPAYSLVNPAGVTVWGACWFNGGPAPCAYVLVHRVLAPGATYAVRLTWDQRSGHPDQLVPAGRYRFTASFAGLRLIARTAFTLSRPRDVALSSTDSGRHVTLAVGDQVEVNLPSSGIYVWTTPRTSNSHVLSPVAGGHGPPGVTLFRARAVGSATLNATANPSCYPECLAPSRLWRVTVTVRAT